LIICPARDYGHLAPQERKDSPFGSIDREPPESVWDGNFDAMAEVAGFGK